MKINGKKNKNMDLKKNMPYSEQVTVGLQGGPKKLHTVFMAINLSTLNHFS